jgi:hypothetical protein
VVSHHDEIFLLIPRSLLRGGFMAKVNDDETAIEFELSYRNLEGVPDSSLRAHIHFGRPGVAGCIVIHLCGSGGKPACPVSSPGSGTLTGTLTAADVVACVTGGIAAGQLSEVIDAMHAHATYVNVHNDTYGSGEIRGAIKGKD